jgi:hypothetical protein
MPATILKLVCLVIAFCVIAFPSTLTRAQNDGPTTLYLPIIQRAVPDVSGTWSGAATDVTPGIWAV